MRSGQTPVSGTEMEVLKVLWRLGSGTVREINDALHAEGRRWAYTTVQTLLGRLRTKGYVASNRRGVAHRFRPTVSQAKFLENRLRELSGELCDGVATPLVLALVKGHRFTAEELESFRKLLDELEAKQ